MDQNFSVINNLKAVNAQRNLYGVNLDLQRTLGRLSSGLRMNDAGEDAAGLAISNALRADSAALSQATRNANDGIGIVQIADGAMGGMRDMLNRAVTLASQAASGTVGAEERRSLNTEYQQILAEIDRVSQVTNFKGERLMAPGSAVTKNIYVGDTRMPSTLTVSIGGAAGVSTTAMGLAGTTLESPTAALNVLGRLQNAAEQTAQWRGALGAQENRIYNAVANIQVQNQNITAAESAISDANMAEEVVNLTKVRILMQSGMASLAQANASSQMVMALFRT